MIAFGCVILRRRTVAPGDGTGSGAPILPRRQLEQPTAPRADVRRPRPPRHPRRRARAPRPTIPCTENVGAREPAAPHGRTVGRCASRACASRPDCVTPPGSTSSRPRWCSALDGTRSVREALPAAGRRRLAGGAGADRHPRRPADVRGRLPRARLTRTHLFTSDRRPTIDYSFEASKRLHDDGGPMSEVLGNGGGSFWRRPGTVLFVTFGVADASIPDADGVINGCYGRTARGSCASSTRKRRVLRSLRPPSAGTRRARRATGRQGRQGRPGTARRAGAAGTGGRKGPQGDRHPG